MMQYLRKTIKPIMLVIVIVFVVSCFFMYDTGRRNAAQATNEDGGIPDRVVAVVDGENITLSRLEIEVAQFIRAMGLEGSASSADFPAFRSTVIDRMATLKELDKEITSRKITASKEEVDAAIADIESQFPTREIYLLQLQQNGITEEELRKSVEENMRRSKLLDEVTTAVSTDQTELRNFYDMMKTYAFKKPEGFMMDIAHFGTEPAAEAAKAELESGTKWDDMIESASADITDYSTTASRMFIPTEQMTGDAEFLKELSMDVPSRIISLTSGDHMIVVKRSKEEAGTAAYDEVSADLEEMIVGQKRTALQSKFMQELRARANVELLDGELFNNTRPEDTSADVISLDVTSPDAVTASGDNR